MVAAVSTGLFVGLADLGAISQSREHCLATAGGDTTPVAKPDDGRRRHSRLAYRSAVFPGDKDRAKCASAVEPHGSLINDEDVQYLQFDLEVWSDVDQFANAGHRTCASSPPLECSRQSAEIPREASTCMRSAAAARTRSSEPIVPGSHTITAVVVSAPKDATCLQLDVPSYRGVWHMAYSPGKGMQSQLAQRLVEIGDQVGDVFDADREPDQIVGNLQLRTPPSTHASSRPDARSATPPRRATRPG